MSLCLHIYTYLHTYIYIYIDIYPSSKDPFKGNLGLSPESSRRVLRQRRSGAAAAEESLGEGSASINFVRTPRSHSRVPRKVLGSLSRAPLKEI